MVFVSAEENNPMSSKVVFMPFPDSLDPTERKDFGNGPVPSMLENFEIKVTQFMKALNPEVYEKVSSGEHEITADSFEQYIIILAEIYSKAMEVDKETGKKPVIYIKFTENGYLPNYPARIDDAGNVVSKTTMIARNPLEIEFTKYERNKKNASSGASSIFGDTDSSSDSKDLPF